MAKIKGGYFIKAKRIQESEIAHAPPHVREMWDWFILKANWKEENGIDRGQLRVSYKDIQDGLHWMAGWRKMTYSKWDCEKAMKWLLKATMVTTRKTTRGIVITVLNYDKYQTFENYEDEIKKSKKANDLRKSKESYDGSHNGDHKEDHTEIKEKHLSLAKKANTVSNLQDNESHTEATREPQTTATIKKELEGIEVKKEESNTELIASAIAPAEIISVFEVFKVLAAPAYGNKTQRSAVEELIKAYGLEKTLNAATYAVLVQNEKYAPIITNPYQLKTKFGELVAFKSRQDKNGNKSLVAEI